MSAVSTFINLNAGKGSRAEFLTSIAIVQGRYPLAGIGFQEIDGGDEPREHRLLRKRFPGRTWACWNTQQPILIPVGWTLLAEERIPLTSGLVHVTPPSFLAEAVIARGEERLVWINAHAPWDNPRLASRRRRWHRGLRRRVRFWRRAGFPVLVTVDANRIPLSLHPDQQLLARRGLDLVIGIGLFEVLHRIDHDLPIEPQHNAVGARVRINPKEAPEGP